MYPLQELLDEFKVKSEEELIAIKSDTEKPQYRSFGSGKKPKRVTMSVEQAKKAADGIGVEYFAGFEGRVLKYTITDQTPDRFEDVVLAKGMDSKNYEKNPIIPFAHNSWDLPIGNTIKLAIKGTAVEADGVFMDDSIDKSGRSDIVFKMAASGFLKAASIGFIPKKVSRPSDEEERKRLGLGRFGVLYEKWELLEWSAVTIPANPNALNNAFEGIERKDIEIFQQEDMDKLALLKLFGDENLLDLFVEKVKALDTGVVDKTFIIPNVLTGEPEESKATKPHDDEDDPKKKPKTKPKKDAGDDELNNIIINNNVNIDKSIFEMFDGLGKSIETLNDNLGKLLEASKESPKPAGDPPKKTGDDLYLSNVLEEPKL